MLLKRKNTFATLINCSYNKQNFRVQLISVHWFWLFTLEPQRLIQIPNMHSDLLNKCRIGFDQEVWTLSILLMKSKFIRSCLNTYTFCSSVSVNLFISAYNIFVPAAIQVFSILYNEIYVISNSRSFKSSLKCLFLFT